MIGLNQNYDDLDLFSIFIYLCWEKKLSRKAIVNKFKIGEGSVKGIIQKLQKKKLIKTTNLGTVPDTIGLSHFERISKYISQLQKIITDIFQDELPAYGLILNKYDKKRISNIYKARDYAIRKDCHSAMVLIKENSLHIPSLDKFTFEKLEKEFDIDKKELLITASAQNYRNTLKGIISICKYLNKDVMDTFTKIVK